MEYMFKEGFFGTRAPLFMDEVTLIVALLPILLYSAIKLAQKKYYKAHMIYQIFLYVTSLAVVLYFELGVRAAGGFQAFEEASGVEHHYLFAVLVLHIAIAASTTLFWTFTIFSAKKELKLGRHKRDGLITFAGVVLTSLSGIWIYLLLFVY